MALTSIITVNFHQTDVTIDLLKSIAKSYLPSQVEVIVVDNGTIKNMELIFRPHFGNIKYIQSKENTGFAGGNNLGIRQAKGDYIFLLNNDTEIPAGCIETMIAEMERNEKIGLLSPLLLYFDQKDLVQYAGYTPLNYLTGRNACLGQFEKNIGQYADKSYPTGFCHGAAVMCRKTDLLKAGLMDETYFLYYEELDWCEKFKRIGKQIWFTGKTYVYHKESISVGKASPIKTYFNVRNRMLFIRKNTGWVNTILFSIYYTFIACPKAILKLLFSKQFALAKWAFKGLIWNYTHGKKSRELGFRVR
ncbi:glycosyltransferase family 2 protein [Pedobacter chinensis]|uniref:Glycosyltransferase family 2 protein n=1 Tax=Pedobacter chinensis TaxID=2282421 RepID=A0A369Q0U0_9SPHI|nr:glycosyltransferase family 2 protein [Pedobacter chinensis]RDC56616.1 glycosyltransferase family 2 protein [Pedobacter chinensis]